MTVEQALMFVALVAPLLATCSLIGWIALWAGLSQRHWFIRVAVVMGALSVWFIADPSLWILFFAESCVVAVGFWLAGELRLRTPSEPNTFVDRRFRFSLADLMLAVVAVCVPLAFLSSLPSHMWSGDGPWEEATSGAILGAVILVGALAGLNSNRWWWRLAAVLLFPLHAVTTIGIWLARADGSNGAQGQTKRGGLVLYSSLIVALSAFFWWSLVYPNFVPTPSAPSPNGFEELHQAALMIDKTGLPLWWLEHVGLSSPRASPSSDPTTMPWAELENVVQANNECLARARAALKHEIRAPLIYTSDPWSSISDRINRLWPLVTVMVAQGDWLRQQGQITEAAECYFDVLRLSDAISRGGLLVDHQTGSIISALGLEGLRTIALDLDEGMATAVRRRLLAFDANRELTKTVVARENAYRDKVTGWDGRWFRPLSADLMNSEEQRADERVRGSSAGLRLLACHLALMQYRRDHGIYPQSLGELVGEYLTGVPLDPFSGRELIFEGHGESYRLFSVGPNGADDDGLGVPWPLALTIPQGNVDIVFDPAPSLGTQSSRE